MWTFYSLTTAAGATARPRRRLRTRLIIKSKVFPALRFSKVNHEVESTSSASHKQHRLSQQILFRNHCFQHERSLPTKNLRRLPWHDPSRRLHLAGGLVRCIFWHLSSHLSPVLEFNLPLLRADHLSSWSLLCLHQRYQSNACANHWFSCGRRYRLHSDPSLVWRWILFYMVADHVHRVHFHSCICRVIFWCIETGRELLWRPKRCGKRQSKVNGQMIPQRWVQCVHECMVCMDNCDDGGLYHCFFNEHFF